MPIERVMRRVRVGWQCRLVGRGDLLYEKDGEKYFVVDGHVHYWDASPGNWIEGQEEYAKGWIECFYGYHKLGPDEYYWPMEKFRSTRKKR